jgi:hypothetical protein
VKKAKWASFERRVDKPRDRRDGELSASRRDRGTAMARTRDLARRLHKGKKPTLFMFSFEDRFQHQHCYRHADPITQGQEAQRPEFAGQTFPVGDLPILCQLVVAHS